VLNVKTWRVTITRELSQEHDMEIEADTEDEACEKAEEEIYTISDDDWEESDLQEDDPKIKKVVELTNDGEEPEEKDEETAEG
jgi:hypothetical protein